MSIPADNYIISRDANEAERLDFQHRSIISCQGYYLHPEVSIPSNAKIADLCTGTAIWLREVATAIPTAECYGFDISNLMFPDLESLPPNVQVHTADVKQPFESRWIGYFDVVHLRLIQASMTVEDWASVLRNITTLLKPGGWLQWVEDDRPVAVRHGFRPVAPLGQAELSLSRMSSGGTGWQPPRIQSLTRFIRSIMPNDRADAMNYGYMNLDALMSDEAAGNLEHVGCDGFVIDREDDGGQLRRAWAMMGICATRSMIKAREDLGAKIADISHEEYAQRTMKEIDQGAHYVCRATVFIGRKKH